MLWLRYVHTRLLLFFWYFFAGEVLAAANPELHAAALNALDFGPEDIDPGAHVSYSSVTGPGN